MYEAENHDSLATGLAATAGMAIFAGMANGRAKHQARMANASLCGAAASAACSDVYQASAAALRERLADAEEDVAVLTSQRDEAERKLEMVLSYVADLRAAGRIAA